MADTPQRLRIGLTGGIASGKSLVADAFAELGVPIIDTDVIAREVVEPGQPALARIRAMFGEGVITDSGELDRRALRDIVFSDSEKREQLEALLHPLIRDAAFQQAEAAPGPYHIIVVPLLAESPMRHAMDRIIVVDCSTATQLARLLERDSESEDQARRIIAAQASRDERLSLADDVVSNDGSIDETLEQVNELHQRYLSLTADSAEQD